MKTEEEERGNRIEREVRSEEKGKDGGEMNERTRRE
ncbi:hypothetical protein Pcinc_027981, partial [Petrolisthes cinctipes]